MGPSSFQNILHFPPRDLHPPSRFLVKMVFNPNAWELFIFPWVAPVSIGGTHAHKRLLVFLLLICLLL